ncbi:MAG: hypothetical protein WCX27_00995 [Candidatus Paceibacterota bacterium]|jgi:hypothetical protein
MIELAGRVNQKASFIFLLAITAFSVFLIYATFEAKKVSQRWERMNIQTSILK